MQTINAQIIESDVRFYPDFRRSAIEFIYRCEKGEGRLSFPLKEEVVQSLFELFETPYLNGLQGSYVRLLMDDSDRVTGLKHIVNNNGMIKYDGSCI